MVSPAPFCRSSTFRLTPWNLSMTIIILALTSAQVVYAKLGDWRVITPNSGITAMHGAVTRFGTVVLMHNTNSGPSNITFPGGRCRDTNYDHILHHDCYAHSVLLDPVTGKVRPLFLWTDSQCSSGQFVADGTLVQTGGNYEGVKKIRTIAPCSVGETCDWNETTQSLIVGRWYSTNQLLPDGRQIVVGGRSTTALEFVPNPDKNPTVDLLLLSQAAPYNLYPYVHLLPTGNLFIFANRDSIIYDYETNTVLRIFPTIPGNPRTYPNGGSSVMLPLTYGDHYQKAEVVVCGGAALDAIHRVSSQLPCSITCGRITVTDPEPAWVMEDMPIPRCMGDMILLPDENVLIINGAQKGCQGWLDASKPVLNPVLYTPTQKLGSRFATFDPTQTPRLYHSTANLLPDASVLVAGSNSHKYYYFMTNKRATDFPTVLSVESFTPPYAGAAAGGRPFIISSDASVAYNQTFPVHFWDSNRSTKKPPAVDSNEKFTFAMTSSPWSTHTFSQGQRLFTLEPIGTPKEFVRKEKGISVNDRTFTVKAPPNSIIAPATYYMLWVVKNGNPSTACTWVQVHA